MLEQSKKSMLILLSTMLVIILAITPISVQAEEYVSSSIETVLSMDKEELLNTLLDKGLVLPRDYEDNRDLAQHFVYKYTPLIINGEVNSDMPIFNANQSNEMLKNLASTLESMKVIKFKNNDAQINKKITSNNIPSVLRYTLQDSTPIGSWSSSYENYNCYAYSIGRTYWMHIGDASGRYASLTMPISELADIVLADLDAMGYWGYKTTTKPSSLPDQYFRVISVRKDTNNEDYHFMKMYGSLNSWAHKPSWTQPLKWNYSSPGASVWSNEAIVNGRIYAPTVTYESAIYYIIYKGKNDPGIQPQSLIVEEN